MCFSVVSWIFRRPRLSTRTPIALLLSTDPCARFWTSVCLSIWILLVTKMPSSTRCCVPNCSVTRDDKIPLHTFPHPEKDSDRFRSWLYAIDGDLLSLHNQYIYKYRRVCHKHFEVKYHTWTRTLSPNAVPTLQLPGLFSSNRPMRDLTNKMSTNQNVMEPQSSKTAYSHIMEPQPSTSGHPDMPQTSKVADMLGKSQARSQTSKKSATIHKAHNKDVDAIIKKLIKKKDSYATRLKKALKLSENQTFQNLLKKFTTIAAMFTVMQFREITKNKMGRRFTKQEKIMALSLYKQGPRAYRWLSKVFVLPSPLTLSRLISRAGLKPGINKKIFMQLKKRVQLMSDNEKLCMLLFDEMAISPHFDYNRKKDLISGFVNNGIRIKREIADHALVFMLRGVVKNYKLPLAYTFCRGTTPKDELKVLIKDIIIQLQNCGLKVLATVCDQGTTNVSAINNLINETRSQYIRKNEEYKYETFEVNGEEIIPLFDPPHLIKGIRNNLLTKHLKCIIDNEEKLAKWDHIIHLYEENPAYKGLRLIKNLTEAHVMPKKILKMKVKYATQIFSKTVAKNMGYLADKGILPWECKDTADVLLFFDNLFDSMNGSYDKSKKKSAKPLLGPVTPKSQHTEQWKNAVKVLNTMKFVTKDRKESSVPSISNWIRTLENIEHLKNKLFNVHNMKSIWMRHFNQDPLENFFGCIRSHGYRNTSPTPIGFEAAFASLLISKISNNSHSPGSNCEEDFCTSFQLMRDIFNREEDNTENKQLGIEIDMDDLNCNIVNFEEKRRDPKINAEINYVSGYVLRHAKKKIFKNCKTCKNILYDKEKENEYLNKKEYFPTNRGLTYPSEEFVKLFSEMQDIVYSLLEKRSDLSQINNYCKTVVHVLVDYNFINCHKHKNELVKFLIDYTSRFFICNWCRDVNNLLTGTRRDFNANDLVKQLANKYFNTRHKKG